MKTKQDYSPTVTVSERHADGMRQVFHDGTAAGIIRDEQPPADRWSQMHPATRAAYIAAGYYPPTEPQAPLALTHSQQIRVKGFRNWNAITVCTLEGSAIEKKEEPAAAIARAVKFGHSLNPWTYQAPSIMESDYKGKAEKLEIERQAREQAPEIHNGQAVVIDGKPFTVRIAGESFSDPVHFDPAPQENAAPLIATPNQPAQVRPEPSPKLAARQQADREAVEQAKAAYLAANPQTTIPTAHLIAIRKALDFIQSEPNNPRAHRAAFDALKHFPSLPTTNETPASPKPAPRSAESYIIEAQTPALAGLFNAGAVLLDYWKHETPVHAGSDAAADFIAAMKKAKQAL